MKKSVGSRAAYLATREQRHAADWAAQARGHAAAAGAASNAFRRDQFLQKARRAQRKVKSYAACARGLLLAALEEV